MKIPKEMRVYCPRCKQYTVHKVKILKKGRENKLRHGVIHHEWDKKGYGGQKFPQQRKKAKTSKKVTLILECKKCSYKIVKKGFRSKKAVIKR